MVNQHIEVGKRISSKGALEHMENGWYCCIPHDIDKNRFKVFKLVSGEFWCWHINNQKWRNDVYRMSLGMMKDLDWRKAIDGTFMHKHRPKDFPSIDHYNRWAERNIEQPSTQ